MKKQLLIAAMLMAGCHLFAQNAKEVLQFQTRSLATDHIRDVAVETVDGNITVTGVPDGDARVEVLLGMVDPKDHFSGDELKDRATRDYDFSLKVTGQKLVIVARAKQGFKNWEHGCCFSFRLYVPRTVSTHLQTNAGHIDLSALAGGSQQLLTTAGDIHIRQVAGKIDGRATAGKVMAEHCAGDIKLTDSGGPMELADLNGTVEAKTTDDYLKAERISGTLITSASEGKINLSSLSCSLDASTNSAITVSIINPGKYIKLRSQQAINVALPMNVGMNLTLHGGEINVPAAGFKAFSTAPHDVEGVMGNGGVLLTANGGNNGTVRLTVN